MCQAGIPSSLALPGQTIREVDKIVYRGNIINIRIIQINLQLVDALQNYLVAPMDPWQLYLDSINGKLLRPVEIMVLDKYKSKKAR